MTLERLRAQLEGRAPGEWELYRKTADSRERVSRAASASAFSRREEGWAARWWESGSPRFAAASTPTFLEEAIVEAARSPLAALRTPPPEWPAASLPASESEGSVEAPPDLFETLGRQLSAESRGEAHLAELAIRRGSSNERILNGRGLDVSLSTRLTDGVAVAIGRRGARACEARVLFRCDGEPDTHWLARCLSDRSTLPLSDRSTPIPRGEWLLDPSVAAALLAGIAPLFCAQTLPRWVNRRQFASPGVTIVDDACADAPFDGEGTPTRPVRLVENGAMRGRLHDLCSARRSGALPTGHGVRSSYRVVPSAAPRRLFFETAGGAAPLDLLAGVRRGLFASALTAPVRIDFERDRYEVEFTGVSIASGHAQGPVAGARARGRVSQLLERIRGYSTERVFWPLPLPVGAPTLLVERAEFD
jgi:predicted Zn-dependent protease